MQEADEPVADADVDELMVLPPERCRLLVEAVRVGRLAYVEEGQPSIVVLNHAWDGPDLVFRTSSLARITRLTDDGGSIPAVFEADSALASERTGWSVLARGRLSQVIDPERQARVRARLRPWARGSREVVLQLEVDDLTGRMT